MTLGFLSSHSTTRHAGGPLCRSGSGDRRQQAASTTASVPEARLPLQSPLCVPVCPCHPPFTSTPAPSPSPKLSLRRTENLLTGAGVRSQCCLQGWGAQAAHSGAAPAL